MGHIEDLIRRTVTIQADSLMVPLNIGREAAEERQDNYAWFHQVDVSPAERAHDLTVEPKVIKELF